MAVIFAPRWGRGPVSWAPQFHQRLTCENSGGFADRCFTDTSKEMGDVFVGEEKTLHPQSLVQVGYPHSPRFVNDESGYSYYSGIVMMSG